MKILMMIDSIMKQIDNSFDFYVKIKNNGIKFLIDDPVIHGIIS